MTEAKPELQRALIRWQRAAGPYWAFVGAAPFLGDLDPEPVEVSSEPLPSWLAPLLTDTEGLCAFLDLYPERSLPWCQTLIQEGFYVVPLFQRWTAPRAVLSGGFLLDDLVAWSRRVRRPKAPRGVIFLLDAFRQYVPDVPGRRPLRPNVALDNRYIYHRTHFPHVEFLREKGTKLVRWISEFWSDDLDPYYDDFERNKLASEAHTLKFAPDGQPSIKRLVRAFPLAPLAPSR